MINKAIELIIKAEAEADEIIAAAHREASEIEHSVEVKIDSEREIKVNAARFKAERIIQEAKEQAEQEAARIDERARQESAEGIKAAEKKIAKMAELIVNRVFTEYGNS